MIRFLKSIYYGLAMALFLFLCYVTINYAMSEHNVNQKQMSNQEICQSIGDYAATFMSNRQTGVSLAESRKQLRESNPPVIISSILDIVLTQAYALPVIEDKVNAVIQFSIMYMSSCFSTLEEKETAPKGQKI